MIELGGSIELTGFSELDSAELIILKKVLKWQLIAVFVGVVAIGIVFVGIIFNYILVL